MNWANYLIQTNLYFLLFYAFYFLFLRNETFFTLNRVYLLGAATFSLVIPILHTEWVNHFFFTQKVQQDWSNVNFIVMQGFATPIKEESVWTLGDYLTLIYLLAVLMLSIRLIYKLSRVKKMFHTETPVEAFSFFKKIRVNENLPQKAQIEKHEQTHAQQLHSADVLFFEILVIINWFNPIIYLYKKSIRNIHEFIADEQALHLKNNKKEYAMLLFSKSFGINPNHLTNNFFNQSLLKRRIMMLQKPKSRKTAILKYGLSAPLFLLAMVLSSATISSNKTIKKIENQIKPAKAITEILIPKAVENLIKTQTSKDDFTTSTAMFQEDFSTLKKHLRNSLKYPISAKNKGLSAKIAFEFSISKSGAIYNVKALNNVNKELSEEGIRSLSSFKDKMAVNSGTYTLFINFKLEGNATKALGETENLGALKNYIGEVSVSGYDPYSTALNEVKINADTTQNDDPILSNVEQLPTYPGGLAAFGKFLAENLNYPAKARENKIEGRVYLNFVVEKDGSLSNIKVVRGIGAGCDEEAVRVLAISPKWNPGIQDGKIVRVSYTIPIFFQITASETPKQKMPPPPPAPPKNVSISETPAPSLRLPPPPPVEISSNNKALFVIDGKEFNGNKDNLPKDFNSGKIELVNVLKGVGAIKAYGDKGKNGVIIITTKATGDGPIIYQDGKIISNIEMKQIDPKDMEAVHVLKGDAAIKKYGDKGKNGVIEITTKKKD